MNIRGANQRLACGVFLLVVLQEVLERHCRRRRCILFLKECFLGRLADPRKQRGGP